VNGVAQKDTEKDTVPIDDANMIAYLELKGYTAIPYIKTEASENYGSRVSWDVIGNVDQINEEIGRFWANETVGVRDFVRILKDVRSNMYNLKNMKGQLKG